MLNPPHGEKDDFEKITVTLPRPIRQLLLNESHWRKTERDPDWSISVIVREALGRRPCPSVANDRLRHMLIGYARVSKADGS